MIRSFLSLVYVSHGLQPCGGRAVCRINCLFCLANLTADPWHRKWMMGKEAGKVETASSLEDGENLVFHMP